MRPVDGVQLQSIFKQWSAYTIGTVIKRITGFLMIPVYTHYLSPADYGIIELIELFIVVAVITFGVDCLAQSMVRIYYDYDSEKDRNLVVSSAIVTVVAMGLGIVVVGYFLSPTLSQWVFSTGEFELLITVSFVALFFGTVADLLLTYERVCQNALFFVGFSIADLIGLLSLNIYFIAYLGLGIWGFVLSKLIVMALGSAFLLVRTIPKVGVTVSFEVIKSMAKFGLPLIFAGLALFIIHSSDRFFLNEYASLHDVGIYSLAYKFAILLTVLVAEPFGRIWDVSVYAVAQQEDWEARIARIMAYLTFALVLIGLGISVFIDETLVAMADPRFHGAAAVVPILILGYLVRECADFLRQILFINKKTALVSRLSLYCAVVNVILNFLLIRRFGMYGAALSTLLTWLFYFLLCWRAERREFGINLPFVSISCLIGLAILTFYATTVFAFDGWIGRIISDSLWIVVFLCLTWSFGYFSAKEKKVILEQVSTKLRDLKSVTSSKHNL